MLEMKVFLLLLVVAASTALACEPTPAGKTAAVATAEAAVARAKVAWLTSEPSLNDEYIAKFEPYHAVLQGTAWRVYGSLEGPGGTPEASVCESDGSTTVWHGQ